MHRRSRFETPELWVVAEIRGKDNGLRRRMRKGLARTRSLPRYVAHMDETFTFRTAVEFREWLF